MLCANGSRRPEIMRAFAQSPGVAAAPAVVSPSSSCTHHPVAPSHHHESYFVVVSLERESLGLTWGISLSCTAPDLVVVGHCSSPTNMLRGSWTCCTTLPPWLVQFSSSLTQQVVSTGKWERSSLLPGDVVLAVNGRPLREYFGGSLVNMTQHLRDCFQVSFLVVRFPAALAAAAVEYSSYEASLAASQVLRRVWLPNVGVSANANNLGAARALLDLRSSDRKSINATSTPKTSPANPLFYDAKGKPIPYSDNESVYDPEEGQRAALFLKPDCRKDFATWLSGRKRQWQLERYKASPTIDTSEPSRQRNTIALGPFNPLFRDEKGKPIPYCDNEWIHTDPDERAALFLTNECQQDFGEWLANRKQKWRSGYKLYPIEVEWAEAEEERDRRSESAVAVDFWSQSGFASFQQWLRASTLKWKQSYRWNRKKRRRLEQDWDEVVQLEDDCRNWDEWLRVRKNQWRVMRRKRQLERLEEQRTCLSKEEDSCRIGEKGSPLAAKSLVASSPTQMSPGSTGVSSLDRSVTQPELILIDALLEEQERGRFCRKARAPIDLMALFAGERHCPDDVVAHCLSFLHPTEHGKLLCISSKSRKVLMKREPMWRQLCPTHWKLPRRPRKPWHEIYLRCLEKETVASRKRWDDLLANASIYC